LPSKTLKTEFPTRGTPLRNINRFSIFKDVSFSSIGSRQILLFRKATLIDAIEICKKANAKLPVFENLDQMEDVDQYIRLVIFLVVELF
jgi:hypothetical protein